MISIVDFESVCQGSRHANLVDVDAFGGLEVVVPGRLLWHFDVFASADPSALIAFCEYSCVCKVPHGEKFGATVLRSVNMAALKRGSVVFFEMRVSIL